MFILGEGVDVIVEVLRQNGPLVNQKVTVIRTGQSQGTWTKIKKKKTFIQAVQGYEDYGFQFASYKAELNILLVNCHALFKPVDRLGAKRAVLAQTPVC